MRKYQQWWENELNRCTCVYIIHTYTDTPVFFNVRIIKSICRHWELQPVHYVHPMWNPQILTFVSSQRLKCKISSTLGIPLSKSHIFIPNSLGLLKSLTEFCFQAASPLTYPFLSCCREGCSHSSVPDIPILPSPAILDLLLSCIQNLTRDSAMEGVLSEPSIEQRKGMCNLTEGRT